MEEKKYLYLDKRVADRIENLSSVVWKPSPLIRWKRVEIDKLRYEKVLQQLWQGDMGEQEWRDVPEED